MIRTVAVLADRYRGKQAKLDATRTHALSDTSPVTLCGRIMADATTEAQDDHAPATCPTCAKRDRRSKTGGPFILASLLQLS